MSAARQQRKRGRRETVPTKDLRGAYLRRLREKRGLSQHEVARRAQMTAPHLSMLERGDCAFTIETAEKLAYVLGVHPAHLVWPTWKPSKARAS